MINRIFIFSLFLLSVNLCQAQFTDSTHYYAGFVSTGSANKTDDGDSYLLNNSIKFGMRKKSISLNLSNTWIYGKQDQSLTNNDFSSGLDFNLYKTFPHFFYWGLANYNTSYSLKINGQLLAGAGAAYNIIDRKNALLNISDGILYDKSDLYLDDSVRDVYHTFRNSLRLLFRFSFNNIVILDGSSFLQNSLSYHNDYIIRSNYNLNIKLKKWLTFTTSFSYNKLKRTERENMLLSYGLTLEKYF